VCVTINAEVVPDNVLDGAIRDKPECIPHHSIFPEGHEADFHCRTFSGSSERMQPQGIGGCATRIYTSVGIDAGGPAGGNIGVAHRDWQRSNPLRNGAFRQLGPLSHS
jgi:hypothetical protein